MVHGILCVSFAVLQGEESQIRISRRYLSGITIFKSFSNNSNG